MGLINSFNPLFCVMRFQSEGPCNYPCIRASITHLGRAATRESRPVFSVGAIGVMARDGPRAATPQLRPRAAPEVWPGLGLSATGRAANPQILFYFIF